MMGRLRVVSDVKWGPKVRAAGAKALAEAIPLVSKDNTEGYDSLEESWADNEEVFKEVSFGGGTYTVFSYGKNFSGEEISRRYGLTDEERKINLNHAPVELLSRLFQIKGDLSKQVADDFTLFLVDWRDENTTKDKTLLPEDCSYHSFPAHCKNSNFEVLEEIFWIPGMTADLFQKVKEDLTVYGEGRTNINTATVTSLMAHGLSETGASKIVSWREAGHVFEKISWITGRSGELGLGEQDREALAKAASSGLFGLRSYAFQGVVRTTFGGKTRGQISFIINRDGDLLSWQE